MVTEEREHEVSFCAEVKSWADALAELEAAVDELNAVPAALENGNGANGKRSGKP